MPDPRSIEHPPKPGEPDPELDRRRRSALLRVLPDFVIIGAMKAGTTSLYQYLCKHPLVHRARRKEVHYFDINTHRGLPWYRAHFPTHWAMLRANLAAIGRGQPRTITGEASPYYLFHPQAAARCRRVLPHAKIIVMLRDPAQRAYSHFQHNARQGIETLTFEDALQAEPDRTRAAMTRMRRDPGFDSVKVQHFTYAARGRYARQLERWLEEYPREQVLVIKSEPFFENPTEEYERTLRFLGLPPAGETPFAVHNDGGEYQPMSPATRDMLREKFAEPNRRLGLLLGEPAWW